MIQVVNRAFDILEFIAKDRDRVFSLTEIADGLGLNHATCANIIKTMVQRNYIEQVGHKKGYRVGFMTFRLSGDVSYEKELIKASKPIMAELTTRLNETSLLGILKRNLRVSLHQELCENDLLVRSKAEKEAYSSASGRLLVAMLDDKELEAFVAKYQLPAADVWKQAATKEDFFKTVQDIREKGVARQRSEAFIVGYAVPIYKDNKVIASLSMFLPESRENEETSSRIIHELKKASQKIGSKLIIEG